MHNIAGFPKFIVQFLPVLTTVYKMIIEVSGTWLRLINAAGSEEINLGATYVNLYSTSKLYDRPLLFVPLFMLI